MERIRCFMLESGASIFDAPPGAMFWQEDYPGGRHLMVQTPGGLWDIDAGWTRSGTPPEVTADPSILVSGGRYVDGQYQKVRYHGWLRDGWLEPAE